MRFKRLTVLLLAPQLFGMFGCAVITQPGVRAIAVADDARMALVVQAVYAVATEF